jgi:hypothetical protein
MRACTWHMSTWVVLVYTPVGSSNKVLTWSVTVTFGGTRHVTVVHRHIHAAVAPHRFYSMDCHLLIVLTGETLCSDRRKPRCRPMNVHICGPTLGCPHGSKSSSPMVGLDTLRTSVWTRRFTMLDLSVSRSLVSLTVKYSSLQETYFHTKRSFHRTTIQIRNVLDSVYVLRSDAVGKSACDSYKVPGTNAAPVGRTCLLTSRHHHHTMRTQLFQEPLHSQVYNVHQPMCHHRC